MVTLIAKISNKRGGGGGGGGVVFIRENVLAY